MAYRICHPRITTWAYPVHGRPFNLFGAGNDYIEYGYFNGGEPHIKIKHDFTPVPLKVVDVDARITTMEDFMHMVVLTDILRKRGYPLGRLIIPYFPGGRMDRRTGSDVPFTLKVFADLVNDLGFEEVVTLDPHSIVMGAFEINTVPMYSDEKFMAPVSKNYAGVVAPDAGAAHRVEFYLKERGITNCPIVQCLKQRDPVTGKLSGFNVQGDVPEGDLLVVDDICDGGGTFFGIIAALRQHTDAAIDLFVTHGIFANGTNALLAEGNFNQIFSTDSFLSAEQLELLNVVPLRICTDE